MTLRDQYLAVPTEDQAAQTEALQHLVAAMKAMTGNVATLLANNHFAWYSGPAFWQDLLNGWEKWLAMYRHELDTLQNSGESVGMVPLEMPQQPTSFPALLLPQAGELALNLGGHNRAAGNVFTVGLANLSDRPIHVSLMAGDVLQPSNPAYQRMMIGRDTVCTVRLTIRPDSALVEWPFMQPGSPAVSVDFSPRRLTIP